MSGHGIAYRSFHEAVLHGELQPGEIMTQQQVADRLGISRTPLREAIRIRHHEGPVQIYIDVTEVTRESDQSREKMRPDSGSSCWARPLR